MSDRDGIQYDDRAYPAALRGEEEYLLDRRRATATPGKGPGDWLSVGLSGGGIRSATFGLGVFEAWARSPGFLRRIDYISTVSGGGYLGSFLGRLFSRDYLKQPEDFEGVLRQEKNPEVLRFLRENGRYMAPNGAGDTLMAGAALLRNWVSMHLVIAVFVLAIFLALQAVRVTAGLVLKEWFPSVTPWIARFRLDDQGGILWSPYLIFPVVIFLFLAFPLGWAYWLVEQAKQSIDKAMGRRSWDRSAASPLLGVIVALVCGFALPLVDLDLGVPWLWHFLGITGSMTILWWLFARFKVRQEDSPSEPSTTDSTAPPGAGENIDRELHHRLALRHRLTQWLTWALALAGALLIVAVIDSLGQSLYVRVRCHQLWGWIASVFSAVLVFTGYARKIAVLFSSGPNKNQRPRLSVQVIATIAALLLGTVLLLTLDVASHAVAWKLKIPEYTPKTLLTLPQKASDAKKSPPPAPALCLDLVNRGARSPAPAWIGFAVAIGLSWLFGRTWPFVNRSSHHSLYASRLTRAYLGASNPARWRGGPSVTQVLKGDDLDMARYWPPPSGKATPLHLINVTVNETVDGRSQIQQTDRKGVGMALGPCGLSAGAEHHAVIAFGKDEKPDPYGQPVQVFPAGADDFRVFRYTDGTFKGEALTLGDWVGVSGAAFSTGLGAQTSVGLSFLAGFGNVRLGRWWNSGVERLVRRRADSKLGGWLENQVARAFPVQICLLDEFLARFPGTARKHWYLSDGGHFENLGGYELIRRRLPVIVIVDAEQDTDFEFGGLANLVRKARLDFGAEIEFLEDPQLKAALAANPGLREEVGTLEELRRGRWENGALKEPSRAGHSRVHAALACVTYSPGVVSRLIYIKPTLTGDEPTDVLEYHRSHPDFPHEPTSDQFFDEAQWESYRRLGDHIAEKLLPLLTAPASW